MKRRFRILVMAILVAVLCSAGFTGCWKSGGNSENGRKGGKGSRYYTQIDNSKITENEKKGGVVSFTGNQEYLYTLPCYDAAGKEKDITFGVSKKLNDGAYIELAVKPVRGVVSWEEVQFADMPEKVQEKYRE